MSDFPTPPYPIHRDGVHLPSTPSTDDLAAAAEATGCVPYAYEGSQNCHLCHKHNDHWPCIAGPVAALIAQARQDAVTAERARDGGCTESERLALLRNIAHLEITIERVQSLINESDLIGLGHAIHVEDLREIVDPEAMARGPLLAIPADQSDAATEAVPRCPICGHMPHDSSVCFNMASDNDCNCPGSL